MTHTPKTICQSEYKILEVIIGQHFNPLQTGFHSYHLSAQLLSILYLFNPDGHFLVLNKLNFSAASDTDNSPQLLKYVSIQFPGHCYFAWVSSPIIGFSSVSSAGSSFSARLFSKESGPGPLLLHQTLSPGDRIYTRGCTCHFHICSFYNDISCMDHPSAHRKHRSHYLSNMSPNKIIDVLNPPNLPYLRNDIILHPDNQTRNTKQGNK